MADVTLVTTTINVPDVLRAYKDFWIYVAGDLKSPHGQIEALMDEVGGRYLHPEDQKHWACSEAIGWNTIRRRNIAILQALKDGADVIVTIDDDNIPLGDYHCDLAVARVQQPALMATWDGLIFDYGVLFDPPYIQRGSPVAATRDCRMAAAPDDPVGITQGVVLGEPDRAARDRLEQGDKTVGFVPEVMRDGLMVDGYVPVNTQNTAIVRELVGWFPCLPHIGRSDDIWGSFIAQRAAREMGYRVEIGPPFVWQERNEHDIREDYEQEWYGDRYAEVFVTWLEEHELGQIGACTILPPNTREFWQAWRRDVRSC